MRKLRALVEKVALSDRPVLVTGPTGSGKELTVMSIHELGPTPAGPLVDLNCGAFPAALIESQLFGHERGAFTGAERKHDGFFTTVGSGTLFLDEIAELPLDLQAKLLRVLESRTFRPLGAAASQRFDGRVIAATHVDLTERVAEGRFREDLYYRLNVLELRVPSLEERREDIPALLAHFISTQSRPLSFADDAMDLLMHAPWPGNVRQLRNLVDRIAVFAPDGPVSAETVESLLLPRAQKGGDEPLRKLVREVLKSDAPDKFKLMEGTLVEEALLLAQGNKSAAARLLGVHRKVVERRLG
jgi:DNA-binding NtrC family response regulator